ncbi:hypothetical protein HMPREF9194_01745 [Treponema maltophilum ATCC 51939]|uniref:Uncharacterized protein n=1 Tax=Treponema maltophilum ATCC 51939 TaxID=1125699 RepID=S3L3M7_TREMA|nr:galactokinase family protein [Treponema maltophilum]EPF31399.1 hypothetical protein HMPREF9194_01745 [Treponema maltophilum ATCC 51939]
MIRFSRELFELLYGTDRSVLAAQEKRYNALAELWHRRYGTGDKDADFASLRFFSSPGRSEIGGNHTDHNLGKVLAASIRQDCIAAVRATDDNTVYVYDPGYNADYSINIGGSDDERAQAVQKGAACTDADNPPREEKGSAALIRGIVQGFKNAGYKTGGFKACFTSDVIAAAGVSSSAAFEMLICVILNNLFNGGKIPLTAFPAIGSFAENRYWNKKSGMLDQTACVLGSLIAIDFKNPAQPLIEKIPFDFDKEEYALMIVNTGSGHADLSEAYSAIPAEMQSVARALGKEHLRDTSFEEVYENLCRIRKTCGDRAVMRAFHFFEENERVDKEVRALKTVDFTSFLNLITESGNSSWKWLQNICIADKPESQPVAVCLALTEHFIRIHNAGACRVHGGGFAGVIQAFIPRSLCGAYTSYMEKALGYDAGTGQKSPVFAMSIRPAGAVEIPT